MNKKFLEKWVLIPVDILLIILSIRSFLSGHWIVGIILIFISLLVGGIGQALHKDKSASQLAHGEHIDTLFKP